MKIIQQTVKDQLVQEIKNQILSGQIQPGDKIPTETELSEKYSVSRSSVREALQHLFAIGLLERDKKTIYVSNDVSDIISEPLNILIGMQKISPYHFFETRLVLEVAIAGIAANNREQKDITRLKEAVLKMEKSRNVEEFIDNNILFHTVLARASKNPLLIKLFEAIQIPLKEQQEQVIIRGIARIQAIEEHKEIIEAILGKNQKMAQEKMYTHVKNGMERFI